MSAYNSTISDAELRDLFRTMLIEGDESDALTETFIEMEQKIVFGGEAAFALPLHKEQELFNQLNHGLGTKLSTAGKLGMKWIFTGLGGACVATGLVVYNQLSPEEPAPKPSMAAFTPSTADTTAVSEDSIFVEAPTDSLTPEPVTKQSKPSELPPLPTSERIDVRTDPPVQEPAAAARGERTEPQTPVSPDDEALADSVYHGIKRLELDLSVAGVVIHDSPDERLTLKNQVPATAVQQKGQVLKITTPKNNPKKVLLVNESVMEGEVLNLYVPKGTELVLHLAAGNLRIEGVMSDNCDIDCGYGDVTIVNSTIKARLNVTSGDIELHNHIGAIDATASFGDLTIRRLYGNIHAQVASGDVTADNLIGDNDIECDFGNMELSNLRGITALRSASGNITLDSLTASSCSITSDFGNVNLSEIQADLHVIANSGNVMLQTHTGNLAIESTFGNIEAANIRGALQLVANSGSTTVRDLDGNLNADVDFGNLKILNSRGNAFLVVTSGSIETKNMELTDSLDITIDYGDGKIGLKNKPEDLRFDVESSYGVVKINKGDMKLEKENGSVTGGTGRIAVRGSASSGSLTFN